MSTSFPDHISDERLADDVPEPRRRTSLFRHLIEWLILVLVIVASMTAALTLTLLFTERQYEQRIYPNIHIRGVDVSGMTVEEARAEVERAYGAFLYNPVELQFGEASWHPAADELGLRLVLDDALDEALAYGRGATRLENVRMAATVWQEGMDLPLRLEIDQQVMQQYLLGLAATIEDPPRDAALWLQGATVVQQPEHWGRQVLIDETVADMTATVQELVRRPVVVRTREVEPRLRDAEVAPFADELRLMLSEPIVLNGSTGACGQGCQWQWSIDELASWLSVRRIVGEDGEPTYAISLDPTEIRNLLRPLATAVREEGTLPRVAWNGGNLVITAPGANGQGMDVDQAVADIRSLLAHEERTIELPMVAIPPPVTANNLASLGITDQVASGVSSFANSEQYRITNIRAGARRMHGVLIPPGARFSFNDQLGSVDAANGFVEGLAIVNNRTQKEWGGGLCQVSTTVFRAAFFAGVPINERHAHAFRISWYEELGEPPGFDAAIFTPYNDLRFTNDTGHWLLMESYVDLSRQRLSVALYGTPTGRTVTYDHRVVARMPAPTAPVYVNDPTKPVGYVRQSDVARGGITIELYRTITRGGESSRQTFATEFRPWPNIYVRGTGR
ncbi:VanW family protein [Candidatus Chloroploca sp. Khr17]|uniref:VanW family protein n=1 Tax=Candidatus Chloroploca sp. Khr17 TaxID=2496869 RepID=UPI001F0E7736|nr:VanW family protein [Candidatus Chloroploca sp. Khr17]